MQHYYYRLATYCMYVDTYSYQLLLFFLLSSFISLGTGRRTQEAEPVQGAYP